MIYLHGDTKAKQNKDCFLGRKWCVYRMHVALSKITLESLSKKVRCDFGAV